MERKKVRKAVFTAAAVTALAGGTAVFAAAYWNGSQFDPSGAKKDLQANQVVFPGDESVTGNAEQDTGEDSELWEKKENAENQDRPQSGGTGGYLLDVSNIRLPADTDSLSYADRNGNPDTSALADMGDNGGSGTVYDMVDSTSDADLTIADKGSGGSSSVSQISSNASGNQGEQPGNGDTGAGTTTLPSQPGTDTGSDTVTEPETPSSPGTSSTPDTPSSPETPSSPDTPSEDESDQASAVKDPEPTKNNFFGGDKDNQSQDYTDDHVKNISITDVVIMDSVAGYRLYKGQSVTGKELFYTLTTHAIGSDKKIYVWGADAYNKYIRVDGVSFDGGNTYISSFPVTIPRNLETGKMKIKVSYRLSTKSENWTEVQVDYVPADSRIYVLSKKQDGNSDAIDEDTILNLDSMNQCLEEGTKMNLYRWQSDLLGTEDLDELFPGWMENGKKVDWFYPVTTGQHILEPMDRIPLADGYKVNVKAYFMSDDLEVGNQYKNLCYLQTLTGYEEAAKLRLARLVGDQLVSTLEIPEYVQAVDADGDTPVQTTSIEIPSTVLYINYANKNLQVSEQWKVSEDNPVYTAGDDGILLNKQETKMLSIPEDKTEITVPANIEEVYLAETNNISKITIKAETAEELPELNCENLKDSTIILKEELVQDYMKENFRGFTASKNNVVTPSENPDVSYHVSGQVIVSDTGRYNGSVGSGNVVRLPMEVNIVGADGFDEDSNVTTIMMPAGGSNVTFEPEGLEEKGIKKIVCYTEEQYESVTAQLKDTEITVEIITMFTSEDGFTYSVAATGDTETVTLMKAPAEITEFYGEITGKDGQPITVTSIGANAFEGCTDLTWVTLPENITEIGSEAFKDCTGLEGLLIDTKDTITIGDDSLEGCTSLRFVGSNAMTGIMEADYDPCITDQYGQLYFYVPTGSYGYTANCISFTAESGVEGYSIKDLGEKGKALCGTSEDLGAWILLRSSKVLDAETKIPDTVIEIYSYAMADTVSDAGAYTMQWNENGYWNYIDNYAFVNAAVGNTLQIHAYTNIFANAFEGCSRLESVEMAESDSVHSAAFRNCSSLQDVRISGYYVSLDANGFEGCNQLKNIWIESYAVPSLSLFASGIGYQFNMVWTPEEESEQVRIHVAEAEKESYVKNWRYFFAGYVAWGFGETDNLAMKDDVRFNLMMTTGEYPTEAEVNEELERELLEVENRLRRMLELPTIEKLTDVYFYTVEEENFWDIAVTLTGVPKDMEELDITTDTIDVSWTWYIRNIATDAFSRSKGLRDLTLPDTLQGLEQNAFRGVEFADGEKLTVTFEGSEPPELMGASTDEPYSFGVDDKNLSIAVPEDAEDDYLDAWVYPLLGYENFVQMQTTIGNQLAEENEDQEITKEQIFARMAEILMPAYNRLRVMMGMGETTEEEVKTRLGLIEDTTETDPDETEEVEWPDFPEFPDYIDWALTDPEQQDPIEAQDPVTEETPELPEDTEEREPSEKNPEETPADSEEETKEPAEEPAETPDSPAEDQTEKDPEQPETSTDGEDTKENNPEVPDETEEPTDQQPEEDEEPDGQNSVQTEEEHTEEEIQE